MAVSDGCRTAELLGNVNTLPHRIVRVAAGETFHWLHASTRWLDRVSGHWWFLAIIAGIAAIDSVIPILPGETTVIIGGVASAAGHYSLVWVVLVAAVAAFVGDNLSYQLGLFAAPWFDRRSLRRPKTRRRLDWATEQIHRRGGVLMITARFLPGGRTALTLASGTTRQPRRWFMKWVGIASLIWAGYGAIIGYVGGRAFERHRSTAFVAAIFVGLSATVVIEVVRRVWHRSKPAGGASTVIGVAEMDHDDLVV